jgi:hypothetical protein
MVFIPPFRKGGQGGFAPNLLKCRDSSGWRGRYTSVSCNDKRSLCPCKHETLNIDEPILGMQTVQCIKNVPERLIS